MAKEQDIEQKSKDAVEKTLQIINNNKEIKKYSFRYQFDLFKIQLITFPIIALSFIVSTINIMAINDRNFLKLLVSDFPSTSYLISNPILVLAISIGIITIILSLFLHFYFGMYYKLGAMYYTNSLLKNKNDSFEDSLKKAKLNMWRLIKAKIISNFYTFKLLKKQIKESRNWKPDKKITLYNSYLLTPFMAFENLSIEDAIEKSSKIYTKNIVKIYLKGLKLGFLFFPLILIEFVGIIFATVILNIIGLILSIILVSLINLLIGIRYTFLQEVFLVVFYNELKQV